MNRILRAIIAVIFIMVITVCAVIICQKIPWRADITEQKLYTLSDGTKNILGALNQPVKMKLYYTKTAAMKAPDQIRYFNSYYYFVKALLDEYVSASNGMIDLQVIDPRPFSDEEVQAIRYGLTRFTVTEEENFFFGLVVQTQFGVEKVIEFFSPDRQNFIEYDISYLIDTAITREKKRVGILSSIAIAGDDVSGYMAQMMRMQGQQPKPAWAIVSHLKQLFDVSTVSPDVDKIEDVDILLVVHPKNLPDKTLFAIDQFVLKGGRTIICVDPHCVSDQPDQAKMRMGQMEPTNSNLDKLLNTWGLDMPDYTFAGDRSLAITATPQANSRPEKVLAFLNLQPQCFSDGSVITADLNQVRVLFPGALKVTTEQEPDADSSGIKYTPLLSTTDRGNVWTASGPYELMAPDYTSILQRFADGSEPVTMGCMVTGRFKSSFPEGVEIVEEQSAQEDQKQEPTTRRITGLTEASENCAVIVFADVDFISDMIAYRRTFFGITPVDDNSSLLLNSIEDLAGSSDLISIRSRGSFKRPFTLVEEIEMKAEADTSEEEAKINDKIAGFQQQLNQLLSKMKGDQSGVIGNTIVQEKKAVERDIHEAKRQLRLIKQEKRQRIDKLGQNLRNFCTLPGPIITLIIAVILGIRRTVIKRHYISHASDA